MMPRRLSLGRSTRWMLLLGLIALIGTSAAIAQVWTHLRAFELGYKISKATVQRNKLRQINRRLRVEAALLKSPERLARVAAELKLAPPEPEQVRLIGRDARATAKNRTSANAGPASLAAALPRRR